MARYALLFCSMLVVAVHISVGQDYRNNMFSTRTGGFERMDSKRQHDVLVVDPTLRPFYHGVASGDPLSDRVIVWTRVTPENGDASVPVAWSVATDPELTMIVRSGTTTATADRDFTVKIDVDGLQPATVYYYGFVAYGKASLTGRMRTTPEREQAYDHARLAVVTCSNYPAGFFNAYGCIADRNDLDAVVHLGDYIYEYSADTTAYSGSTGKRLGRMHDPDSEIIALSDYRTRYAQYRLDPELRRLHQQHPMIHVWDDHESANDSYVDGAENHTTATEGEWSVRKAIAKQVHAEWMPIREQPDRIYRSFQFGTLALLMMLDTRLDGRMKQIEDVGKNASDASKAALNDPNRRLITTEQYQWLVDSVSSSLTRWNVIGSQVLFSPVQSSPIDTTYLFNAVGPFAVLLRPQIPQLEAVFDLAFQGDVWNNYPAQRTRVADALHDVGKLRPSSSIVISGDFHCSFALDGRWPDRPRRIVEFMTPSITSSNFDENLATVPLLSSIAPALLSSVSVSLENNNAFLEWHDIVNHGYMILDLVPDRAHSDWFFVDTLFERSNQQIWVKGLSTIGDGLLTNENAAAAGKPVQDVPAPPTPPIISSVESAPVAVPFVVLGYGPTPATTASYITVSSDRPGEILMRIVDASGSVVGSWNSAIFAGINSLIVDLQSLSSGRYTLILEAFGHVSSVPLLKQQ